MRALVLAGLALLVPLRAPAGGQDAAEKGEGEKGWELSLAGSYYLVPHGPDRAQLVASGQHGDLHLEARYGYEAPRTVSAFVGWRFAFGDSVSLELTPLAGIALGDTRGLVPGLELTLAFWRFELYSESEYLFDLGSQDASFMYQWAEATISAPEWLRAGLALQRTRLVHTSTVLEVGPLVGVSFAPVSASTSVFGLGTSDWYAVFSLGVDL